MRKNRNFKFLIKKIFKKSYAAFSFLVIMLLLFNSLSLYSKKKNKYLFLTTHKITTPIFLKPHINNYKAHSGTKFAQKRIKRSVSKAKQKATEEDTTKKNKVISLIERNGVFELRLQIKDTERKIIITVYNLLAKKVLDVFHGYPHKDSEIPYYLKTSSLSEGVYLCIIQGENFRLLKKFIISR